MMMFLAACSFPVTSSSRADAIHAGGCFGFVSRTDFNSRRAFFTSLQVTPHVSHSAAETDVLRLHTVNVMLGPTASSLSHLFHGRFLKEFEILSVFTRFLTHVFNLFTVFYVFIFTCSTPLLCFVSFTVP